MYLRTTNKHKCYNNAVDVIIVLVDFLHKGGYVFAMLNVGSVTG